MKKATFTLVLVSLFLFPLTINASEGIPLQMDVFLGILIYGPEDLPEQISEQIQPTNNQCITGIAASVICDMSQE